MSEQKRLVLKRGPNLYDILELQPNATKEDIRKNYRRLAFKYHPDKNENDPEAAEKFKLINKANSILGDETKRELYDKFGDVGVGLGKSFRDDTIKKVKTNRCLMCLLWTCSILTCCYCCCCCLCCCCCCGNLEFEDESPEIDLSTLNDDDDKEEKKEVETVVVNQPTSETK